MKKLGFAPSLAAKLRPCSTKKTLEQIADGDTKEASIVGRLRYGALTLSEQEKNSLKKQLPAICCGVFRGGRRKLSHLKKADYIIMDLDHIAPEQDKILDEDPVDIHELKKKAEDTSTWIGKHCSAMFRSPSGDGLKMLFEFSTSVLNPQHFRDVWAMVADKILQEWDIQTDKACKDVTRLCFLSHDPAIYVNNDAKPIGVRTATTRENENLDTMNSASIKLRPGQDQAFLQMLQNITISHYPEFRDMCSAASRLGKEFLSYAYDTLFKANQERLSSSTAAALKDNKDTYMESFLQPHQRVPLQAIAHRYLKQGGVIEKVSSSQTRPMFDISDIYADIIREANNKYASYQHGESIIVLPSRKKQYNIIQAVELMEDPKSTHVVVKRNHKKTDLMNQRIRYIAENGKIVSREVFDIWWQAPQRRRVEKIVCLPHDDPHAKDPDVYNLWRGFNVRPHVLANVIAHDALPILDFVYEIIADGRQEVFDFIINWTAEMMQNPSPRKPGVCLGLIGIPGTGKGTFSEILHDMIGMRHVQRTEDMKNDILSTFNSLSEGKLLIILNEAFYQHDRRLIENFKGKITESTKTIEPKYVSRYNVPDIARYLILTNHDHVVHMEKNDRRFFLTEISEKRAEDREYFANLKRYVAQKGREAFFKYLMQYNVNYDRINTHDVQTKHMLFNKKSSFDSFDNWVSSILFKGKVTYPTGKTTQTVMLDLFQTNAVSAENLYASYAENAGRKKTLQEYEFMTRLHQLFIDAAMEWKMSQDASGIESIYFPSYYDMLIALPVHAPSTREERIIYLEKLKTQNKNAETYPGDLPF